jgi:hypothetical protein
MVAMAMVVSRRCLDCSRPVPARAPAKQAGHTVVGFSGLTERADPGRPSVFAVNLFRTKSVEHIGRDARGEGPDGGVGRLRTELSARHLVGFGIGIVIGTGIFTLTGVEARDTAGPAVVLSFAIAGVVAVLAALCYAELAASVPTAGSAYSYAYATVGELIAWLSAGTCSWSSPWARRSWPAAGRATSGTCSTCRRTCSGRRGRRSTSAPPSSWCC